MVRWGDQFKKRMEFKDKQVPSMHRRMLFFSAFGLQLVSSLVVVGIMAFYTSQLKGHFMPVPWMFIFDLLVSIISITSLCVSVLVYYPAIPPPKKSIVLNTVLLCFRTVTFALLTNAIKTWIMSSQCGTSGWGNSTGVMVCRVYKTLFSFEIISLATTLFSLGLAFYSNSSASSGAYIRTSNPKFDGIQDADEYSEYRGLTQGTPSIAPSSAPLYSGRDKSPDGSPDNRSLGFPSTPRSAQFGKDTELSYMESSRRSAGYAPEPSPRLIGRGEDLGEVNYLSPDYLSPDPTYLRVAEKENNLTNVTER